MQGMCVIVPVHVTQCVHSSNENVRRYPWHLSTGFMEILWNCSIHEHEQSAQDLRHRCLSGEAEVQRILAKASWAQVIWKSSIMTTYALSRPRLMGGAFMHGWSACMVSSPACGCFRTFILTQSYSSTPQPLLNNLIKPAWAGNGQLGRVPSFGGSRAWKLTCFA